MAPDAAPADSTPPDGPPPDTLTVTVDGIGVGEVSSTRLTCGSSTVCTMAYPDATEVMLVARAALGSKFTGWGTGECALPRPDTCIVKVHGNTQVHATFAAPVLVIDKSIVDGFGSISSNLGDCSKGCEVRPGSAVSITATASVGHHSALLGWTYPACTGTGPCTFAMPAGDASAVAIFGRDDSVDNGSTTFTATKEGSPLWAVEGFQTAAVFGAIQPQTERLWKGHGFNTVANAFYPQKTHVGPYTTEPARRCMEYGWDTGDHFPFIDWSNAGGRSLAVFGVIVPSADAPIGSTRDYLSGPMLPRTLALYVDADLYKDGALVDPDFDGAYPTLAQLDPSAPEAGSSHLPLTFAENQHYIPGTPGTYRLHVHVYESATPANGWQIDVPFAIDP